MNGLLTASSKCCAEVRILPQNLTFSNTQSCSAQEPVLFAADIMSNICFGTPGASEEEVRAAAVAANAAAFIERLPEGYHTQVRCHVLACPFCTFICQSNQKEQNWHAQSWHTLSLWPQARHASVPTIVLHVIQPPLDGMNPEAQGAAARS